jgi:hypothetical protein
MRTDRQTDPPAVGFHSTKYCTRKNERVAGDLHRYRHSEGENFNELGKNIGKTKIILEIDFFSLENIEAFYRRFFLQY